MRQVFQICLMGKSVNVVLLFQLHKRILYSLVYLSFLGSGVEELRDCFQKKFPILNDNTPTMAVDLANVSSPASS